jgi:hypothetical protein
MNDSAMLQRKTNTIAAGIPLKTAKNQTNLAFCLSQNLLCNITAGMANTGNIRYSGNSGGCYSMNIDDGNPPSPKARC